MASYMSMFDDSLDKAAVPELFYWVGSQRLFSSEGALFGIQDLGL